MKLRKRSNYYGYIGILFVLLPFSFFAGCASTSDKLITASAEGNIYEIQKLISEGADINNLGDEYCSPIFTAILYKRREVVEFIIQKGADVNARCGDASVLNYAVSSGSMEMLKMIMANGGKISSYAACSLLYDIAKSEPDKDGTNYDYIKQVFEIFFNKNNSPLPETPIIVFGKFVGERQFWPSPGLESVCVGISKLKKGENKFYVEYSDGYRETLVPTPFVISGASAGEVYLVGYDKEKSDVITFWVRKLN